MRRCRLAREDDDEAPIVQFLVKQSGSLHVAAVAWCAFLFFLPWSIAGTQLSLGIVCLMLLLNFREMVPLLRQAIPPSWWVLVGLFLLWQLASALLMPNSVHSLLAIKEDWLFLAVPAGMLMFRKPGSETAAILSLSAGIGLTILLGVLLTVIGTGTVLSAGVIEQLAHLLPGYSARSLTYANLMGMAGLFLLAWWFGRGTTMSHRAARAGIAVVALLALLASAFAGSRTAVAGLSVCLMVIGSSRPVKERLALLAALGLGLIVLVVTPGSALSRIGSELSMLLDPTYEGGRQFIWKITSGLIMANPLFGVGPANFTAEYVRAAASTLSIVRQPPHAHNDLFHFAVTAGIPAALAFVGIWVTTIRGMVQRVREYLQMDGIRLLAHPALIASLFFIISSLTEATFTDERLRPLLMVVWGYGLAQLPGRTATA